MLNHFVISVLTEATELYWQPLESVKWERFLAFCVHPPSIAMLSACRIGGYNLDVLLYYCNIVRLQRKGRKITLVV